MMDSIEKAWQLRLEENFSALYALLNQVEAQDLVEGGRAERHYLLGDALVGLGQHVQALEYYGMALREHHVSEDLRCATHLALSAAQIYLGDTTDALKHALMAHELSRESIHQHAMALELIGKCYYTQSEFGRAELSFLRSIKAWGRLNNLAVDSYEALGRIAEEKQDFLLAFRRYSLARLLCGRSTTVSLDEMKSSQAGVLRLLVSRHWPIALIFLSGSSLLVFLTTEALGWSWLMRVAATFAVPTLAGLIAILISILVIE